MNSIKSIQKYFFKMNNASVTKGNYKKLRIQRYNTIARKLYFNVRVVDH